MDPAFETPEVLLIDGGRIEAVGPRDLLGMYPHAEVQPLEGRTLLPGFIDAHIHAPQLPNAGNQAFIISQDMRQLLLN